MAWKVFALFLGFVFAMLLFNGASARSAVTESAYDRGLSQMKQGAYQEAIASFRTAFEKGNNKSAAVYHLALCYQKLGDLKNAHESFKIVCTRFPNSQHADRAFEMMKQTGVRLAQIESAEKTAIVKQPDRPLAVRGEFRGENNPPGALGPAADYPSYGPNAYVVPFTDEALDGRMYIDGKINGKNCKLLFDTGAGVTFMRQTYLNKHNMSFDWLKEKAIIPGALRESPAKVALAKISIGSITREEKIYVEQDPPDSLYPSFDNCPIIGQSFFGDLSYEVDGKRNLIIFRRPTAIPQGTSGYDVPFKREGFHIVVTVKVNGKETEMYLDTGASQVVFADRHLAQCGLNRPVEALKNERRTADGKRDSYSFTLDMVGLGMIERRDVGAALLINSKFSKPLLGQTFLQGMHYTVDPVRKLIRFQ